MEGKDFFLSKATLGAILLLAAPVLAKFGIVLDEAGVIDAIMLIGGAVTFLWGQLTRKKAITSILGVKVKS